MLVKQAPYKLSHLQIILPPLCINLYVYGDVCVCVLGRKESLAFSTAPLWQFYQEASLPLQNEARSRALCTMGNKEDLKLDGKSPNSQGRLPVSTRKSLVLSGP